MEPTAAHVKVIAERHIPERKRKYTREDIVHAVLYKLVSGHSWRNFPRAGVPKSVVRYYWDKYFSYGRLSAQLAELVASDRVREGREPQPTAAIIDSQSVDNKCGGEHIGYDGNKKKKGRKRHSFVDVGGRLLCMMILPANIHDQKAAYTLVEELMEKYPTIKLIWADSGYKGPLQRWCKRKYGVTVKITGRKGRKKARGFKLEKRRWVVERTFAWGTTHRELAFDNSRMVNNSLRWYLLRIVLLLLKRQNAET